MRWYRPDGSLSLTREPGAVPSVTTVLARVWPRPALQAWRERQLLELAAACPPGDQPLDEWVRSLRLSLEQTLRAAADEGSRIHAELASGRVPPAVVAALARHGIDFRQGQAEVTIVGSRYGGTIDALGPEWLLDWKTSADQVLQVWPDWLVQLAAYDELVGGRATWVLVVLSRVGQQYRVYAVEPDQQEWARRAWRACLALWDALEEARL
jgi:hypothetical protein